MFACVILSWTQQFLFPFCLVISISCFGRSGFIFQHDPIHNVRCLFCIRTDEDGEVEVEDADNVLQQLREALTSGVLTNAELIQRLKSTFKLTEKVCANVESN